MDIILTVNGVWNTGETGDIHGHHKVINILHEIVKRHYKTINKHHEILKRHHKILKRHHKIIKRHYKIVNKHHEILKRHYKIIKRQLITYLSSMNPSMALTRPLSSDSLKMLLAMMVSISVLNKTKKNISIFSQFTLLWSFLLWRPFYVENDKVNNLCFFRLFIHVSLLWTAYLYWKALNNKKTAPNTIMLQVLPAAAGINSTWAQH